MGLKGKFVVVTGASTGIGRAIAIELAKSGAFVALVARNKTELGKTKKIIEEDLGKAGIFAADLGNADAIDVLVKQIRGKTRKVDLLVNVAGVWHGKNEVYANTDFEKFPQKVILETYAVGITAPSLLAHAFAPVMPKRGKIVNISGTFGSGAKGWLPYYVSKRAIEDFTIGLAEEFKGKGIQVNCISPSDTATEAYKKYFPQCVKQAISLKEIAKFALALCSSKAGTGNVFVVKRGKKPYKAFHA